MNMPDSPGYTAIVSPNVIVVVANAKSYIKRSSQNLEDFIELQSALDSEAPLETVLRYFE